MAIGLILAKQQTFVSAANTATTTSFTSTSGNPLIAFVLSGRLASSSNFPTITDSVGATWTVINSASVVFSNTYKCRAFRAVSNGSARTVTATYSTQTQQLQIFLIYELTGVDTSVNQGVVQSAIYQSQTFITGITLPAALSSNSNEVLTVFASSENSASKWTSPAGYTITPAQFAGGVSIFMDVLPINAIGGANPISPTHDGSIQGYVGVAMEISSGAPALTGQPLPHAVVSHQAIHRAVRG